MNNARRKQIEDAILKINEGKEMLENVLQDEEDAFESMPENLQYSMHGEDSQEAQDILSEAIDKIDEAVSDLEDII